MVYKAWELYALCSSIEFGAVEVCSGERAFLRELDNEVFSLCRSLPQSSQTDSLLFLIKYFRIPFGGEMSVFSNYYVPAWSIIYWLIQSSALQREFNEADKHAAKSAHSMALLLHPLDDHLNDGQLSATHLTVLLRSQAWMTMNDALERLAERIPQDWDIIEKLIDDYYSSVCSTVSVESLDDYCDHFRKQMATWLIVPVLITKKMGGSKEFADFIRSAYESFGIAWRLLDDIRDMEADMRKSGHSSIYTCLPKDLKTHWDNEASDGGFRNRRIIWDYLVKNRTIDIVTERICHELHFAAAAADDASMAGWAHELRSMAGPLRKCKNRL